MIEAVQIVTQWIAVNYIEIIGSLLGIAYVLLANKQNIWCWPVGFVNVAMYIYIFLGAGLYGDSVLQFFYLVMSVYGWYQWKYGGKGEQELKISRLGLKTGIALLILAIISTLLFGFILEKFTDSVIPYWDGLTTSLGILATWMTARKILENWIIWVGTNLVCVGVYLYKELYPTTVFYFILMAIAAYAYFNWLKDYKKQEKEHV